jgi:hypothetical protein
MDKDRLRVRNAFNPSRHFGVEMTGSIGGNGDKRQGGLRLLMFSTAWTEAGTGPELFAPDLLL